MSGPGALPGFKWWGAAANFLGEKSPEIFSASGEVALQKSGTSRKIEKSLDLHFRISCFLPAGK